MSTENQTPEVATKTEAAPAADAAAAPAAAAPAADGAAPAAAAEGAAPAAGAPGAPPAAGAFQTASLYVGDLHPDVTEAVLFEVFNAVGPVASIRVCRDTVTRRSLGYGYVNFHNTSDAERALDTMNYTPIRGRACRIMWSQRDPSLRKTGAGNVFVKNLDESIDNKQLYDTFSLFGNILSCKVVQDRTTGASKGYGFVHYETTEAAEEAIEKINGMHIANKEVFVGQFVKRGERPGQANWTNVYVKNLPKDYDEAKLKELFATAGTVTSAMISCDEEGKCKGFGFVNFEDHEGAVAAVEELNGKNMGPEEPAVEGEEKVSKELLVTRAQKKQERERELRSKFEQIKLQKHQKWQGANLYIKNLDEAVDEDRLREEFTPFGNVTSVRIMQTEKQGKVVSRGFGFVCFAETEGATKAVADMNGKMILGKPIYVALAQRKEIRQQNLTAQYAQRANMQRGGMPGGMGGPMPGMYGQVPANAPVFFAGGPQMQRPGMFYQQPMMPRGGPQQRGGMPGGYRQGPGGQYGQVMPGYNGQMAPQHMQQQRRNPRNNTRGSRQQQGGQGGNMRQGGGGRGNRQQQQQQAQQQRDYAFTATARNQPGMQQQQAPPQPMPPAQQQQAPMQQAQPTGVQRLTASVLAEAPEEQRRNMIGENLYPLITQSNPSLQEHWGKITGMLLDGMDIPELLHLIESPQALQAKVAEALEVLKLHKQQA